jgi:DNA-binding IclR family transcriptional regulator
MTSKRARVSNETSRKVLRMMLAFTPEAPRLRIDELAKIVATPKSSAYRHLSLLREMGLVEDDGRGAYQLTTRIARLAGAARAANGLLDVARPIMERIRNQSRETVLLYKRVRDTAVCVDLVESIDPIRLSSSIGATLPLDRGAGARVLLAHMPEAGIALFRAKTKSRTQIGVRDAELERIRRDGFAVSVAEISADVWAVAAPVFSEEGAGHSLTIAGPAYRLDETRQRQLQTLVKKAAAQISRTVPG